MIDPEVITIFVRGSANNTTKIGGYGAVLLFKGHRKEMAGSMHGTLARCEITGVIEALHAITCIPSDIMLYVSNPYIFNAVERGGIRQMCESGFDKFTNGDLWNLMYREVIKHHVQFGLIDKALHVEFAQRTNKLAFEQSYMLANKKSR